LQAIYQGVKKLAEEWKPSSAAVEELFFSSNVRTAMSVGHARGVTLLALVDAGLPIAEYTPLAVKQAVTGYGGADKAQMQEMVRALLGLEKIPRPDDAADALAVAIMRKRVNWVLDADIRGFFDAVSHEWLVRFIEHRIADRRVAR
jgi:crossover junction endodeoxyribonuclease RuvC